MDLSSNSSSLPSPLSPASIRFGFTDNMKELVNADIKLSPRAQSSAAIEPLPKKKSSLPPPQLRTFCDMDLVDNEDDRGEKTAFRAGETDRASKVTKSLPHQSPLTSLLISLTS